MSTNKSYEEKLEDFLYEQTDINPIKEFIKDSIEQKIKDGEFSSYTDKPKLVTWLTKIANDFFKNGRNSSNYDERCKIIKDQGFEPFNSKFSLSESNKGKFKGVENLLIREKSDSTIITLKFAIAIFGIRLEGFEYFKKEYIIKNKTNSDDANNTTEENINRRGVFLVFLAVVCAISGLSVRDFINKTNAPDHQNISDAVPFEIEASQFFTNPIGFDKSFYGSVDDSITIQLKPYYWTIQTIQEVGLDSVLVELSVLNLTDKPFFIDKLIIQTSGKNSFSGNLKNTDIQSQSMVTPIGFSMSLDAKKDNWFYMIKVRKGDFHSLPPKHRIQGHLMLVCKGKWEDEYMNVSLILEGQSDGVIIHTKAKQNIRIGVLHLQNTNP